MFTSTLENELDGKQVLVKMLCQNKNIQLTFICIYIFSMY
jgi:hypothetical protein